MNNFVLYGCGFRFHGRSFRNAEEERAAILITTRWFVLLYAPLIPLSSWLVKDAGSLVNNLRPNLRNYVILQRLPLFWPQVLRVWFWTALAGALIILGHAWLISSEAAIHA